MSEKEKQIANAKSRDFKFDFKYDSKNLQITMMTKFVPKFKEWLKDFFRSEFYTDDNFIEKTKFIISLPSSTLCLI